ncbi:Hsp20/alpha crystallin family protein [Acidobacteria bacterium AH-259-O06]|nr:Hsp20/alpha crystallin family protein [Acidobacteria bacterium AH-259-O06]
MSDEKKKKEEKEGFEIDFGLGKASFGGLFEGLGNLIESIGKIAKEGGVISEEGEITGLGDKVKGVYGVTVRTLAGGEAKVETFGNIKKTPKGPVVEEVREPIVDVFDEEDHILVVAELPGVDASDIKIDVEKDIFTLSVETGDRQYHKEIVLPSEVDQSTEEMTFKNGILEVKYSKRK